jgi:hypothetical protein
VEPRYQIDSFVMEPRYGTVWFIRCGANIFGWEGQDIRLAVSRLRGTGPRLAVYRLQLTG